MRGSIQRPPRLPLVPPPPPCYTLSMDDKHTDTARTCQERRLDEALKETFPASDPVAIQQIGALLDRPENNPHRTPRRAIKH